MHDLKVLRQDCPDQWYGIGYWVWKKKFVLKMSGEKSLWFHCLIDCAILVNKDVFLVLGTLWVCKIKILFETGKSASETSVLKTAFRDKFLS